MRLNEVVSFCAEHNGLYMRLVLHGRHRIVVQPLKLVLF